MGGEKWKEVEVRVRVRVRVRVGDNVNRVSLATEGCEYACEHRWTMM